MRKAEEIVRRLTTDWDEYDVERMREAVNEALEWAAQRCEGDCEVALDGNEACHRDIAKRIRAAKSR